MENLSIFRENLFDPRIFPLNELYFSRDRSSIIRKRIYHFLKKTFSIHGSKRVIFFTRSIIDHQIQNLSLFKENPFDPRILRFSTQRVIFFTRFNDRSSIIDHRSSIIKWRIYQLSEKILSIYEFFIFPFNELYFSRDLMIDNR